MITILAAVAALEAIFICFLLYCFQKLFDAAKEDEPLEPIQWEGWEC